jgi:hypothetical protein
MSKNSVLKSSFMAGKNVGSRTAPPAPRGFIGHVLDRDMTQKGV